MKFILNLFLLLIALVAALLIALNIWGFLTLGQLTPAADAERDPTANRVVMVFGATGSVGDGLLKAALDDPGVERIIVVTRSLSPRIEAAADAGQIEVVMQADFTDYSALAAELKDVNTVMWGLGTSSLNVDDATYTWIHVDFPVAFVSAWLEQRQQAPMSFHYVTGMGTDRDGDDHWAREKGRAERELAEMAEGTGLRTFSYHSGYIRPADDIVNPGLRLLEWMLVPGSLVITGPQLGQAMFEISARSNELPNGTLLDNEDSLRYAKVYRPSPGG